MSPAFLRARTVPIASNRCTDGLGARFLEIECNPWSGGSCINCKTSAFGTEFARGAKADWQGTIYPDVVESSHAVKGPSQTVKSHHNVDGLPPDLKFELCEPLRDLFKDEVRGINRVVYDISSKPPATIEWE